MKYCLRGAAIAAAIAVSSLACSSAPASPNSGDDAGTTEAAAAGTTFTDVYTTIMAVSCTNSMCHFAGATTNAGAGSLDMSSQAVAYAQLVNVPATTAPLEPVPCAGDRVVPGSPSTSLLYLKVSEPSPPCGSPMPLNAASLSLADQNLIMTWIAEGAKE